MQPTSLQMLRRTGVLTAALLASLSSARAIAADKTDAFPSFDSYIKISGQAASITGDESAFQARTGQPYDLGGGIEEYHYSRDLSDDTTMLMDGRALAGSEDYLLRLNFAKSEVGSIDVGYKRFRTFYDGVGGFFPIAQIAPLQNWLPLDGQELFVDRGKFWAEVKIARPDQPEFTIRYTNETRDGRKDSTSWGDATIAGVTPATSTTRKIAAGYLDLNERHQALEGSMKQTVGNTTFQLTLLGDRVENTDARNMFNQPNNPVLASRNTTTSTDGFKTDTAGIMGNAITEISPKVTIRTGLGYQNVDSEFTGERRVVSGTGVTTFYHSDLVGDAKAKIYTGSLALDFKPTPNWVVTPGIRGERRKTEATADGLFPAAGNNPVDVALLAPRHEYSNGSEDSLMPALDVGYTGIRTLALYASASQRLTQGDKSHVTGYDTAVPPAVLPLYRADADDDRESYKLGANWRQSSALTLRGEVFYKDNTSESTGTRPLGAGYVPSYYELDSQFIGTSLTAIVKPINSLSFTTRYRYQQGERQITHFDATRTALLEYDSMDAETQSISETIDWSPIAQFYMQASANLVFDTTSTAYPQAGIPANNVLRDSENDYITVSLLTGFVLTKRDDLQVQFTYYRASNGNADMAPDTLPYGVNETEYSVSVGIIHKVSDHFIASAKVGYFDSDNDTTGGHTDFHGPLAYVSLTYGL